MFQGVSRCFKVFQGVSIETKSIFNSKGDKKIIMFPSGL